MNEQTNRYAGHAPLAQTVRDAVCARYGTDHVHADFDVSRAALIVVDMQKAFTRPEIGYVDCRTACAIIPAVNRLANAVRASGQPVVWLKNIHDDAIEREWAGMYAMHGTQASRNRASALAPNSAGFALDDALEVADEDAIIVKRRYSPFFPGASELPMLLEAQRSETVILAGCTTDICVESTARDAMMHNYRVIVVEDAVAALNEQLHQGALSIMAMHFADVMPSAMVVSHFAGAPTVSLDRGFSAATGDRA